MDCGIDTGKAKEFYFIETDVWLIAAKTKEGMLCIGCIEQRLGRKLEPSDFPDVTINSPKYMEQSQRLSSRMTETALRKGANSSGLG